MLRVGLNYLLTVKFGINFLYFVYIHVHNVYQGSRDSLFVECQDCDQKVASSRSGGRIFFSSYLCELFGVHSSPLLLQWHVKDPSHSAKSAGDRLHRNTHTTLTQRSQSRMTVLSRHCVGTCPGN